MRGSYPHPVLDSSDDVTSDIEVFNVSFIPAVEDVEVRFQLRMDDPDIQRLIDEGSAAIMVRWKCGATIDSEVIMDPPAAHHADSLGFTISIDQERIRSQVTINVGVIARKEIADYRLEAQHADYGDATFHVLPGDVLADAGDFVIAPDKLYDPLQPPVGSCFRFVGNPSLKKGIKVTFGDPEHVLVEFPTETLAAFGSLAAFPAAQVALVALPALAQTITYIRESAENGDADIAENIWHGAILELMKGAGKVDDQALTLAQKILGDPINAGLFSSITIAEEE